MQRIKINVYIKETVRQVGYLLELYQDARSPKYKILQCKTSKTNFYKYKNIKKDHTRAMQLSGIIKHVE